MSRSTRSCKLVLENKFAFGVIPLAGRSQPVQDRDAQCRDLVSIGGASGPAALELNPDFLGYGFGLFVGLLHAFHRMAWEHVRGRR